MKSPYEDIIGLPHPTSTRHPRMPMANRAAQFSPFAALSGYEDAVREEARLTGRRIELSEEEKAVLDGELRLLEEQGGGAAFTYFLPDGRKEGGAYTTVTGAVRRIDRAAGEAVLTGGQRIRIADIVEIRR